MRRAKKEAARKKGKSVGERKNGIKISIGVDFDDYRRDGGSFGSAKSDFCVVERLDAKSVGGS